MAERRQDDRPEHEREADELERIADDLEERTERLGEHIDDARTELDRVEKDPDIPTAGDFEGESEGAQRGG